MINEVKMYTAQCDCCGESCEHWHEGWTCLNEPSSVEEMMADQGWYIEEAGDDENRDLHYCPKCHKVDDNDTLIVDWSRKKEIEAPAASPVIGDKPEAYLLLKNLVDTEDAVSHLYNQGVMSGSAFIQAEHDYQMAKKEAQQYLKAGPPSVIETGEKDETPVPRTAATLNDRFSADFFLKVSVTSDLLPENEQTVRSTLSTAIEKAIYQELGRWRNTGVVVEEMKSTIK